LSVRRSLTQESRAADEEHHVQQLEGVDCSVKTVATYVNTASM